MRGIEMRTKWCISCLLFLLMITAGCTNKSDIEAVPVIEPTVPQETLTPETPDLKKDTDIVSIIDADWASYFNGLNGAAAIYVPSENACWIYNQELAQTRRSPCSTFKIVSSLIALENRIISPENSTRQWSGETFWNTDWNQDLDFEQAFRTSCVWYFREVIDEIGEDLIQANLETLQYGNCDISDWAGHLNTNNNNPALTGFWIESSLKISPKEQTEVMERIFGNGSIYQEETIAQLRQVMLVSEEGGQSIYGKTGMGKDRGVTVDCWFTGFSDGEQRAYFCVYLGELGDLEISSIKAREIAIQLMQVVPSLHNHNIVE